MELLTANRGESMLVKMFSKCMLCQIIYKEQMAELANPNQNITHGYCPPCFEKLMEDDFPLMSAKEDNEDLSEM